MFFYRSDGTKRFPSVSLPQATPALGCPRIEAFPLADNRFAFLVSRPGREFAVVHFSAAGQPVVRFYSSGSVQEILICDSKLLIRLPYVHNVSTALEIRDFDEIQNMPLFDCLTIKVLQLLSIYSRSSFHVDEVSERNGEASEENEPEADQRTNIRPCCDNVRMTHDCVIKRTEMDIDYHLRLVFIPAALRKSSPEVWAQYRFSTVVLHTKKKRKMKKKKTKLWKESFLLPIKRNRYCDSTIFAM